MTEYFDIPEIAYCRVGRAARLLGCEVEDIFHWMETNVIKGCVNIMFEMQSNAEVYIRGDIGETTEYLDYIDLVGGYFPMSEYSVATLDIALTADEPYPLSETDDNYTFFYGVVCGVWVVDSGLQYLSSDDDKIEIRRLKPCCVDPEIKTIVHATCNMEIKKSNLWVLKDDLEKLSGKTFKELEHSGESLMQRKIKAKETFAENSSKTNNTRAQFIKSLLHIHYGNDVAESPRRFLEQNNSIIIDDFRKMNIKPPSGKSVQAWIEMVDIPFNDES